MKDFKIINCQARSEGTTRAAWASNLSYCSLFLGSGKRDYNINEVSK